MTTPARLARNREPRLPAPSERVLVRNAMHLISLRGMLCWRNNSGAYKGAAGQFVRFGRPGSPDIIGLCPGGRFLGVEAKAGGNRPTGLQAAFLAELQRQGAAAFWFNDLKMLERFLDAAIAGWMFGTDASGESVAWPPKEG